MACNLLDDGVGFGSLVSEEKDVCALHSDLEQKVAKY